MKLDELASPSKVPPQKEEKKRRMALAKRIIDMVMKADPNDTKHSKIFNLASQAAGKELDVSGLELKRNDVIRSTRTSSIANSPLNIVKLHSIVKQMEKILKGS